MNLFGVLKYKKMGEDFVRQSGLPFTIIRYSYLIYPLLTIPIFGNSLPETVIYDSNTVYICIYPRPGRLTDGPYTSYDLNTLLKATAGERRAVIIGQGNQLYW